MWLQRASWTQRAPKSVPKHPKRRPGEPQEAPQEPPRAPLRPPGTPQECLRTPKERPERTSELPEWARDRQNRAQGRYRSEKSQFRQKCSATRSCRGAEHFGLPQLGPETVRIVPIRSVCTCKSDFAQWLGVHEHISDHFQVSLHVLDGFARAWAGEHEGLGGARMAK